jgi:preprotein translocase subunit SecA
MFAAMLESLKYEVISTLSKVQVRMPEEVEAMEQQRREEAERLAQMQQLSHQSDDEAAARIWRHKPANVKWGVTILARAVPVKNTNSATAV